MSVDCRVGDQRCDGTETTLSGKHDKAADPEAKSDLLLTGPIAIRGLGRATRDFFRPDKLTKHRAPGEEHDDSTRGAVVDAGFAATEPSGVRPVVQPDVDGEETPADVAAVERSTGDDDRVPTAQIPLTWMFDGAPTAQFGDSEPFAVHPSGPAAGSPFVPYPGALDAAALDRLRRRMEDRDAFAETSLNHSEEASESSTRGVGEQGKPEIEPGPEESPADEENGISPRSDAPSAEPPTCREVETQSDDPDPSLDLEAVQASVVQDGETDAPEHLTEASDDPEVADARTGRASDVVTEPSREHGDGSDEESAEAGSDGDPADDTVGAAPVASASVPVRPTRRLPAARGDGGFRWGYAALAVLAVVCIALVVAAISTARHDADVAAREAAAYTPPAVTAPAATPASAAPVVSVIGDEYVAGTSADSGTKSEWPALLATASGADVHTDAAVGAGYVAKGRGGVTVVSEAARVAPSSAVVILFAGTNDESTDTLTLASAATEAISAAHARAPGSKVVVVGPASGLTRPPLATRTVRDTLRTAARIGDATFADPISGDWLSSAPSLTDANGRPTDAGERVLESKIAAAVRGLL